MEYLTGAIIVFVVSFLMKNLPRLVKEKPVVTEDGTMVLKVPEFFAAIGYIGIGFGALFGLIISISTAKTAGDDWIAAGFVLFFTALGLPLILMAKCTRIVVTDQTIQYVGITQRVKEIILPAAKGTGTRRVSIVIGRTTKISKAAVMLLGSS